MIPHVCFQFWILKIILKKYFFTGLWNLIRIGSIDAGNSKKWQNSKKLIIQNDDFELKYNVNALVWITYVCKSDQFKSNINNKT